MAELKKINEEKTEPETENKQLKHITLNEAVTYNDQEITELDFDFDKLTGADAMNIEEELQAIGKAVLVESASGPYMIRLAVRACKQDIGVDFFNRISMKDYMQIKKLARNFLIRSE